MKISRLRKIVYLPILVLVFSLPFFVLAKSGAVEQVLNESEYGSFAREYNRAFDRYKKSIQNSGLAGTRLANVLLNRERTLISRIERKKERGSRHYEDDIERLVHDLNMKVRFNLAESLADFARKYNIDLNDTTNYRYSSTDPSQRKYVITALHTSSGWIGPSSTNSASTSTTQGSSGNGSTAGSGGETAGSMQSSGNSSGGATGGNSSSQSNQSQVGNQGAQNSSQSGQNQNQNGGQGPSREDTRFKYRLHEKIPGQENVDDLQSYLEALYRFGIAIVAILAVVMIGIGAFMYIVTAAGNLSKMANAKEIIGNAIFGLVMALLAWLILYVINPDLVGTTLKMPKKTINPEAYVSDEQPDPEVCRNPYRKLYQMGLCSGDKACVKDQCEYLSSICLHNSAGSGSNISEEDQEIAKSDLCQSFFAKPDGGFCGSIANNGLMLGRCTKAGVTSCPLGTARIVEGVQCGGDSVCCTQGKVLEVWPAFADLLEKYGFQ